MGPGIQGNREGLKTHKLFIFDVQFLDSGGGYLTPMERNSFMRKLYDRGVNPDLVTHVPVLHYGVTLDELRFSIVSDPLTVSGGASASIIKVLREGSGRRGTVYVLARLLNLCEGREIY